MGANEVSNLSDANVPFMHYVKTGKGRSVLILFHGFGQDHTAFDTLISHLSNNLTIYAFDLYFHGKSFWQYGEAPLAKTFWKKIFSDFLLENNIEKFSLVGFSLGAKFAMATTEAFPERINSLILLAPDGIHTNPWYSLATYPIAIRKLFKSMVFHPRRFLTLVRLAHLLKISDKSMLRFVKSQMDTTEKRRRVYGTWIVFRHLKFQMDLFGKLLNDHHIPTLVITGKFDHVIVSKNMIRLKKQSRMVKLEELICGHTRLLNHPDLPKSINKFMC